MTPASVELSSLIVVAAFRFCDGVHSSQHVVVVAALGDAPNSGVTSVRVREQWPADCVGPICPFVLA